MSYFIEAAYNTLLPKNKYPACFLKIEIDPSLVDVNVHPAKTEIRFQNEDFTLNEIKRAIFDVLHSNSIIKEVKKETIIHDYSGKYENIKPSIFENLSNYETKKESNIFEEVSQGDFSNIKITEINLYDESKNIFEEIIEKTAEEEKAHDIFEEAEKEAMITDKSVQQYEPMQQSFIEVEKDERKLPELSVIGILMDTYIICENLEKTEMYMIDQHAAHERINYERFLNQFNSREIIRQELLVPEVINLSYEDYYTAMNNIEIFENLGFDLENFGINAILINNIPGIFRDSNIKDIFYTILDSLKNTSKKNINLELDKIIKNACVKSVKAGDKLHLQEIKALLNDLSNADNPYTCPHGRPVIIKMTKYEIEKMFERIQN